MTINMQISNMNSLNNSAKSKMDSTNLQNNRHGNIPSFNGKVWEIKSEKLAKNIGWVGDDFNSAQQRLVAGITGLFLQPWFDLNNKRVDEDTRKVSTARTVGKIIAGMTTGVLIRWGLIKAADGFTKTKATEEARVEKAKAAKKTNIKPAKTEFKKWEQCLLPKAYRDGTKLKSFREIKKYRQAFGTVAAVIVMIGTNFLIDAPLTTYLTNKFVKLFTGKDPNELSNKTKGGK